MTRMAVWIGRVQRPGSRALSVILVVDDMAIYREPIEAVLRAKGYEVMLAADGRAAIASVSAQRPDVVILDLGLPVVDGLGVLAHLRGCARTASVPVLILSAEADKGKVIEAAKLGISGYLLKSQFSLTDLLSRIKALLPPAAASRGAPAAQATAAPPTPASPEPEGARRPSRAAQLRDLKPVASREETLRLVGQGVELKGLSPTVASVLNMAANPGCSIDAVAGAIGQDPAVALKILKLANSVAFTRGEPADSVHKAVVRIGLGRIRQAVLNISVVDRFAAPAFQEHLSTEHFWEHAIACGIINAELAAAAGAESTDTAFTTGLLHDVGRVVLAEQLKDRYVEVLKTARATGLPLEQVETRMLGVNHADVMEGVLRSWNCPKDLAKPIMCHHLSPGAARTSAPGQLEEVLRLSLADRLSHALLLGTSGNDTLYAIHEHCQALGVDHALVDHIAESAPRQTDEMKWAMLSRGSSSPWPRVSDQQRERLGPAVPLIVSAQPGLDAIRLLLVTLRGSADGEPPRPNVALVHAWSPDELDRLLGELTQREAQLACCGLPVLLLGPADVTAADHGTLRGRRTQSRAMPAPLVGLVDDLRGLLRTDIRQAA